MISALFAGLTLAQKAAVAGAVLASLGALWGWGYLAGRESVQQAWDAAVSEQLQASLKHVTQVAQVGTDAAVATAERESRDRELVAILERKAAHNAKTTTKPCVLDPGYVALRDELTRVLNHPVNRLPSADASTGEPLGLRAETAEEVGAVPSAPPNRDALGARGGDPLTTNEATQQDIEIADDLLQCRTKYAGLKQWALGKYVVEKTLSEQGTTP